MDATCPPFRPTPPVRPALFIWLIAPKGFALRSPGCVAENCATFGRLFLVRQTVFASLPVYTIPLALLPLYLAYKPY